MKHFGKSVGDRQLHPAPQTFCRNARCCPLSLYQIVLLYSILILYNYFRSIGGSKPFNLSSVNGLLSSRLAFCERACGSVGESVNFGSVSCGTSRVRAAVNPVLFISIIHFILYESSLLFYLFVLCMYQWPIEKGRKRERILTTFFVQQR